MIHPVGLSGAFYLLVLLVLAPAMSFRSAKRLRSAGVGGTRPLPPLTAIYANSIVLLAVLFALAWFTARTFSYGIFSAPRLGGREILAGVAALGFQFAMQLVSRAVRTPAEREAMPVNRMIPKTRRERAVYSVAAIVAGISEEAAYRGVLTVILSYSLGNLWVAGGVSALAFAAAHAVQGWKSVAVIFVMACAMQLLVGYTGTLIVAMAVHAVYDLLAPTIRRRILRAPPTGPEKSAG